MEMGVKSSFVVMAHIVTAGTLERGTVQSVLAKGQVEICLVADLIGRIVNYSTEQNKTALNDEPSSSQSRCTTPTRLGA